MEKYMSIIPNNKVYSQVYSILNLMGTKYINKIPKKLYVFITNNRDKNYSPVYQLDKSFVEQNVNKRALSIICMIDMKYWCTAEEKENLLSTIKKNEAESKQGEKTYYNIFNRNTIEKTKNNLEQAVVEEKDAIDTSMVVMKDDIWIKKIIKKIWSFFRRNKKF